MFICKALEDAFSTVITFGFVLLLWAASGRNIGFVKHCSIVPRKSKDGKTMFTAGDIQPNRLFNGTLV